jgi:hypothetical protein
VPLMAKIGAEIKAAGKDPPDTAALLNILPVAVLVAPTDRTFQVICVPSAVRMYCPPVFPPASKAAPVGTPLV